MPDSSAILDSLHGIASRLDADMSEKDVENTFLNENFYTLLGYEGHADLDASMKFLKQQTNDEVGPMARPVRLKWDAHR
jgi:hypothetical protein